MRIATSSTSEAALTQIQKLSVRQSQLQTQISTGQRISQPSDDPSAVGRIITLDTEARQLSQFLSNADRALEISESTFANLQDLKTISDRAGEIATLGGGASSPDAYSAYAKEVNQLIEEAVQLGNSKLRNDYVFAGTLLSTQPFDDSSRDATTGELLSVAYMGNMNQGTVQLSESSSLAPGSTAGTNQGIAAFINNLIALRTALTSGSSSGVAAAQGSLEGSENLIVNSLSEQGAVQLRLEVSQSQQQARATNIEKLVSDEADADLATSMVKLSQISTAYEAALSSASKIMQMSLLDYLK